MKNTFHAAVAAVCTLPALAGVSTVEDRPGYNSWPMIQAVGNRLVCTYSRGTKHDVFEGVRGAWAKWSDDFGRTWQGPRLIADLPDAAETPIGKGVDSKGAGLFWVRTCGGKRCFHTLYRTTDGEKFEKLAEPALDPMPVQITDVVHVPGRGLVCLWFACREYFVSRNYDDAVRTKSWGELVSADDGRTWTQRTVEKDQAKTEWATEPSFVRLTDGRLLGIARSERYSPETALQWQLESADGGLTWTRRATNVRDVMASTPSLVYDEPSGLLYNYYYERGKCTLKRRVAKPDAVWGRPLAWPGPEVVARGSDSPWDSGNACATSIGPRHFIAYYTGKAPDTSVVVAEAAAEKAKTVPPQGAEKVSVSFARGAWDRDRWTVLKSPRWNYLHGFEQLDDCIANETPGSSAVNWYSSMTYGEKLGVGDRVTVKMSFDDRFAPGIVIAPDLAAGKDGVKELRDHFEVILFDGGLNVWQYRYADGGFVITKPAFLEAPFPNRTPLEVTVAITEKNVIGGGRTRQMTVSCGDRVFGFRSDDLPSSFYVGINANEGRCRFHAFSVK